MWWKRRCDLAGTAFFQGTLAPSLEGLGGLAQAGVEVTRATPQPDQAWAARLKHQSWGEAILAAPRTRHGLPHFLVEFGSGLSPAEREMVRTRAECSLSLHVPGESGDVLRDRKRLLRFLHAVLGDIGVAGVDELAQMVWTRARLDDELQHDAPVDIIHVHVLHIVSSDLGVWLHSHGLAEMGFVDFDVLRPADALMREQFDLLRAIAFAIVEGATSGEIEPVERAGRIALVDAASFMRAAGSADLGLREADGHTHRRVVCCDPGAPGMIARWLGAGDVRPSRFLSRGMEEGRHVVRFSDHASQLTAQRARETAALFDTFRGEFEDLECGAFAKIGYATDSGGREHLWFQVHSLSADGLDATLVNQPFDISRMQAGQRAIHSIEALTDWALMTPLGQLTPRSLEIARQLRELRPQILDAMRTHSPSGAEDMNGPAATLL